MINCSIYTTADIPPSRGQHSKAQNPIMKYIWCLLHLHVKHTSAWTASMERELAAGGCYWPSWRRLCRSRGRSRDGAAASGELCGCGAAGWRWWRSTPGSRRSDTAARASAARVCACVAAKRRVSQTSSYTWSRSVRLNTRTHITHASTTLNQHLLNMHHWCFQQAVNIKVYELGFENTTCECELPSSIIQK